MIKILYIYIIFFIFNINYIFSYDKNTNQKIKNIVLNVFPNAKSLKKQTKILTDEIKDTILKKMPNFSNLHMRRIFSYYVIYSQKNTIIGYVFLDTHTIRTLPETIMVIFSYLSEVVHIEILEFLEPPEYFPPYNWLKQFYKSVKYYKLYENISGITGATLTANSVLQSVSKLKIIMEYFIFKK